MVPVVSPSVEPAESLFAVALYVLVAVVSYLIESWGTKKNAADRDPPDE